MVSLFDSPLGFGFFLTLMWIPTAPNKIADATSRRAPQSIFAPRRLSDRVERAGPVQHRPYGIDSVRAASLRVTRRCVFLTVRKCGIFGSRNRRVGTRCCACTGYRRTRRWMLFSCPNYGRTHSPLPGGVSGARSYCRARYTGVLIPVSAASCALINL